MKSIDWIQEAVHKINADFNRSADTHLIKFPLPHLPNIDFYLKDESTHPTGSLKHRLARSLFLYGICNGWIQHNTPIIEASSGSTAISEAYFAQLLNLRFIAVVPKSTAKEKINAIEFYGGECHFTAGLDIYSEAEKLAHALNGHYMDQFTFAERATDWRGNNNIAESLFSQMTEERFPVPSWVVCGAGTGGTSATIGRYIRYHHELISSTRLCVVDPENSVFLPFFNDGKTTVANKTSRIEGIGRPRVEPSFIPSVIDSMLAIDDADSIGTAWWLEEKLGKKCGPSTGTNVYGAFQLIQQMAEQNMSGSVVTLLCDSGNRYLDTYFNQNWLLSEGIDIAKSLEKLALFYDSGKLG